MEEKSISIYYSIKSSQLAITISILCISLMIIFLPLIHFRLDSKFNDIKERMNAFKVYIL